MTSTILPHPQLDLVVERVIDLSPEQVWAAWTQPELLKQWFCPAPWTVPECDLNVRPGGVFRAVMRGPEGQEFDSSGCYLEVVPNRRLVWTDTMLPGFRPAGMGIMTAVITMEPEGSGTRYTARAMHADEKRAQQHALMGFEQGWGKALDQMVALMKSL